MLKTALLLLITTVLFAQPFQHREPQTMEEAQIAYNYDADLLRLNHILYWSKLVDEFHKKAGHYPFQDSVTKERPRILVQIVTQAQSQYYTEGHPYYREELDINSKNAFYQISMKEFVDELERVLEEPIQERYDMQKVPTQYPLGYSYFAEERGYVIWTPCVTCGVTKISTLLLDGITPTVNIVSEGEMEGQVTKALTRRQLIQHPIMKEWLQRGYLREEYIKGLEEEVKHDSKK